MSSKARGKQPARSSELPGSKANEPVHNLQPTTPPRVSFGIEIEFLVAELREGLPDPDRAIEHKLAPVYPKGTTRDRIATFLETRGIPMHKTHPSSGWEIDEDGSVGEPEQDYFWASVELKSPASYATDEALDMILLVVHLIKSNFRCRVNTSCGLHVHIGNGYDRIEARAARNFAALWWAAEPLITMLQAPERTYSHYCWSARHVNGICLAQGMTAEEARQELSRDFREDCEANMRYYGRERRLGETPEPRSIVESGATFDVPQDGDDDDWEVDGSEPFKRPKKAADLRSLVKEDELLNPGRLTIKRGPPEIPERPVVEHVPSPVSGGDGDGTNDEDKGLAAKPNAGPEGRLPRTRQPPFPRRGPRSTNHRPLEILLDGIPGRIMPLPDEVVESKRPRRQDTWSGAKELFSCDIGTHQVGNLMSTPEHYRNAGMNFIFYIGAGSTQPVRLPIGHLDEAGRHQRLSSNLNPFIEMNQPVRVTVECREGGSSLDGEWIVTWTRILRGLLEWARDADPAELMRVIGLCAEAYDDGGDEEKSYDVVDLLDDVGLWAEARVCEGRLRRKEEAWFECMLLEPADPSRDIPGLTPQGAHNGRPWMTDAALRMLSREKRGIARTRTTQEDGDGEPRARGEDEEDWRQLQLREFENARFDW